MCHLHTTSHRVFWTYALVSGMSIGVYLLVCYLYSHRIGFPLDDAWIHQTFARNLASYGEWSFNVGEPTSGSTSPMWTLLLSVGHKLGLGPYAWTYLLGWVCLFGLAIVGFLGSMLFNMDDLRTASWLGILLLFEWHLVWASISGMETLFFTLFVMGIAVISLRFAKNYRKHQIFTQIGFHKETWKWVVIGMIIGMSIWLRPEGLTLFGPILLIAIVKIPEWKQKMVSIFLVLLGFLLIFLPYLLFNCSLSGAIFPNTYYAKQTEYKILLDNPLWLRIVQQFSAMMIGIGILLLPGFIFFVFESFFLKQWEYLIWVGWILGYAILYAMRLPVVYQHGRYLIPAIPLYLLFSFVGFFQITQRYLNSDWRKIIGKTWLGSLIVVTILFWGLGARAYVVDVLIIEEEMVSVSKWIAQSTPSRAVIAAHDIGALGYFSKRRILDLAGLVNPNVIPFIRDEVVLRNYLDVEEVDYLVTFPSWYPQLIKGKQKVYETNATITLMQGGENMAVYLWKNR